MKALDVRTKTTLVVSRLMTVSLRVIETSRSILSGARPRWRAWPRRSRPCHALPEAADFLEGTAGELAGGAGVTSLVTRAL